jgi:hypothetical protein
MRAWLTMIVSLALCAAVARAADRSPPLPEMFMKDVFDAAELTKKDGKPTHGRRQRLAMVGRDDLIVDEIYSSRERRQCEPLMRAGAPIDPLAEVKTRAASAGRVVIINEAHDDAQSRLLVLDLLEPLHDLRFSYYAAETFYPTVGRSAPAWPSIDNGFYSGEPIFGEVLRRARALGFEFVPYELERKLDVPEDDWPSRIAARENAQTQNLMDRVLRPRPQAKVLVHVGYDHLNEKPVKEGDGSETTWMAARLKAASGIDPLTIDQTRFQSPLDRSVVCALTADGDKMRAASADLSVGLPKPAMLHGRPLWRRARGQVEVAIPAAIRPQGLWSIVEARSVDEPAASVPADRILLAPDEDLPLLVRPGRYRVEAWTREKGWTQAVEIVAN